MTEENKQEFNNLLKKYNGNYPDALFEYCFIYNIFYDGELVTSILKKEETPTNEDFAEYYMASLNAEPKYEGKDFFSQLKRENFEVIYSEELNLLSLSEDDKKNRQQVINILAYDPFKDDAEEDRPQLYRDLTGLLTENMRKDIAKQKAAVEVVKNYSTISKYQKRISDLLKSESTPSPATQKEVDNLLAMVSKIQTVINGITKENGFTSGKSLGNSGRGMLSDVINQVEEQHYDEGITNFYDQATSKSIQEVADISFKAMLAQVKLTGTDYADIVSQQAIMVREAQKIARDASEALRLAKEKITKQKLLDELRADYKRKGISEEEIEEFISREYKMYEGK